MIPQTVSGWRRVPGIPGSPGAAGVRAAQRWGLLGLTALLLAGCAADRIGNDGVVGDPNMPEKFIAPPIVGPGADATTAGQFSGIPGGPVPQVVYPFDHVMLARNINQMRLAFSAAPGQNYFRIVVDTPTYQQTFYLGSQACQGSACSYLIDDAVWNVLAHRNTHVTLTIAGTPGFGLPVGTAAPLALSFSPNDVRGGMYYFSTSSYGLMRLPFGGTKAVPFLLGTGNTDSGLNYCVGCHGVSRDGKKVVALFSGPDGYPGIVDGTDPTKYLMQPSVDSTELWNFASFSPDGTKLITVWHGALALRDGKTGRRLATVKNTYLGGRAAMAEWSPDGKSIVFVRIPATGRLGADWNGSPYVAGDWILGDAGDIAVLPYNDGQFGPAITIVSSTPGGEYHFYPSFSPDSQWIVFNSAGTPGCASDSAAMVTKLNVSEVHCVSYDQTAARLRLVRAAPDQTPIELTAATHAAGMTTAWPKFAPFQQGNLVFFTYSAKFDYGFVVQQSQIKSSTGSYRPQLWMSGIDLGKAAAGGGDPSFPPFWLPFQDSATNNHEVLWTEEVPCTKASDCGSAGEFGCVGGVCVPQVG